MFYVYVLKNKDRKYLYVGYSKDLRKRISQHNSGESTYTSKMGKWKLIYYEAYKSQKDAVERERKLKQHGYSLGRLRKRIKESISK